MDPSLLKEIISRRKGRSLDVNKFMRDSGAKKGPDSPDLLEVTETVMGKGPSKEAELNSKGGDMGSTDELAPSKKETKRYAGQDVSETKKTFKPFENAESVDDGSFSNPDGSMDPAISDVSGSVDLDVYDENEYRKLKNKGKPSTLWERVQLGVGNKLNK